MKTFIITEKEAISAYQKADSNGKKLLSDLFGSEPFNMNIMERIKTFNDVLDYFGLEKTEFIKSNNGLDIDEIAYRQLKLITKSLNEDWSPDWSYSNQYKYFPRFKMNNGFEFYNLELWDKFSTVPSHLCFKSFELARYAGNQFTEFYKNFFTL
jgi:hypothetical protein